MAFRMRSGAGASPRRRRAGHRAGRSGALDRRAADRRGHSLTGRRSTVGIGAGEHEIEEVPLSKGRVAREEKLRRGALLANEIAERVADALLEAPPQVQLRLLD